MTLAAFYEAEYSWTDWHIYQHAQAPTFALGRQSSLVLLIWYN